MGSIHGDFIVSLVSVLHTEIEILNVEIKEGVNELIFDELPKDSSHLISIKLCDRVLDFDFLGGEGIGES